MTGLETEVVYTLTCGGTKRWPEPSNCDWTGESYTPGGAEMCAEDHLNIYENHYHQIEVLETRRYRAPGVRT